MIPCSAVATSARQNEWTISIGDVHRFILSGSRSKAEELVQAYGELYDFAFTAPVKPRELQTLDCDEARDGTVWADSDEGFPFHYQFRGHHWEYFALEGTRKWTVLDDPATLTSHGPYIEVVK